MLRSLMSPSGTSRTYRAELRMSAVGGDADQAHAIRNDATISVQYCSVALDCCL